MFNKKKLPEKLIYNNIKKNQSAENAKIDLYNLSKQLHNPNQKYF